jgi:hypothetical protein
MGGTSRSQHSRTAMQFTPQETRLIAKLRKQNRQWPRTRWLVLAIAVLSIFVCVGWGYFVYSLTLASNTSPLDSGDFFVIALLWTKCCLWFWIGTWALVTVSTKWHGDVNRMLLLRLLDAQEKQQVGDDHGG